MADTDKSVFISYRRSTSKHLARAIFMDLRANGYDVFMDVNTIDSGEFDKIILNQIAARPHFVLLLTPGALDRCNEPDDWLRQEIERAMELQRNIVPIIEEGFRFEEAKPYLVGKLSQLPRYNAVLLYHAYFEAALDNLRTRFLKRPEYDMVVEPTPAVEATLVQQKIQQIPDTFDESELKAQGYYRAADKKWRSGDYDGTIADCNKAIALKPDYAEAYSRRATAWEGKKMYEEAIADCTQAIRLNLQYVVAYVNRGIAQEAQGDYTAAARDYTQAIQINPQDAEAHYNRGRVRQKQENLTGAIADYKKYMLLGGHPEYPDPQVVEKRIVQLRKGLIK